jgi:hypothetical protein
VIWVGAMLLAASASTVAAMPPASEHAVLSAAETCLKATSGAPIGQTLDGWDPAPAGAFRTDGRAVTRDNVLMAVSAGRNGACMIVAKVDAGVRTLRLAREIERRSGARRTSDAPPVWRLPDGRLIRLSAGAKGGPSYIQLAIASVEGN